MLSPFNQVFATFIDGSWYKRKDVRTFVTLETAGSRLIVTWMVASFVQTYKGNTQSSNNKLLYVAEGRVGVVQVWIHNQVMSDFRQKWKHYISCVVQVFALLGTEQQFSRNWKPKNRFVKMIMFRNDIKRRKLYNWTIEKKWERRSECNQLSDNRISRQIVVSCTNVTRSSRSFLTVSVHYRN